MNSGIYHVALNPRGTYKTSDNKFWYETSTVSLNSTADCFTPANIGTVNGRPDSKSDKYVYSNDAVDCREFAKLSTKGDEELLRQDKVEWACEDEVSTIEASVGISPTTGDTTFAIAGNEYGLSIGTFSDITGYVFLTTQGVGATAPLGVKINITQVAYNGSYTYIVVEGGTDYARFKTDSVGIIVLDKTNPILSSGSRIPVELLGEPENYSQLMLDKLSAALGINNIEPNLVDDNGVSNVPDGIKTSFKMNQKMTVNHKVLKSTDSGVTWAVESPTVDYITNTITFGVAPLATDIILVSSTADNKPYHQTDPKPVLEIEPKVIASNDNSIYKGCMITAQVSGKIPVGNSANGLESRVLENTFKPFEEIMPTSGVYAFKAGVSFLYLGGANGGVLGEVYYPSFTAEIAVAVITLNEANGIFLYQKISPQHSALTLNADITSASKYFKVTEEEDGNLYAGIYGEEITYDGISEWGDTDFSQLTNGTLPDVNGGADIKTFHGSISLNIKRR